MVDYNYHKNTILTIIPIKIDVNKLLVSCKIVGTYLMSAFQSFNIRIMGTIKYQLLVQIHRTQYTKGKSKNVSKCIENQIFRLLGIKLY